MIKFMLILTLLSPDGQRHDRYVVDHGMTADDCMSALQRASATVDVGEDVIALPVSHFFACEVES